MGFSQEALIKMEPGEKALETVLLALENDYGILFSYRVEDVEDILVSIPTGPFPVEQFLEVILKDQPLTFEVIQNNFILRLRKTPINSSTTALDQFQLCGFVIDQSTQTALPFANVYLLGSTRGTTTDDEGYFEIKAIQVTDTLVLSYIGYQERRQLAADFIHPDCKRIGLDYHTFSEDFVVVTDYLTDGVSLHDHGAYTQIKPGKVGVLPGQVEPEILKTIHFLPGVTSPDGSVSNISIRGSSSDQNLILWENIPIYHAAHYFGMISAFNPYIIDQASIYKSGFNAGYGGRIAGVIDLKTNSQDSLASSFTAGINMLNGYANGRVSLFNKKVGLVYSIRHSIADFWRSPTYETITRRIHQGVLLQFPTSNKLPKGIRIFDEFKFFDSNIKGSFRASKKDELSFAFFYGNNRFKNVIFDDNIMQRQADTLNLFNHGISLKWKHQWNPKLNSELVGTQSEYNYDYFYEVNATTDDRSKKGIKNSRINERQLHWSNNYQFQNQSNVDFGYQLSHYQVDFEINKISNQNPQVQENQEGISEVHSLYGTFESPSTKRLGGELGLRLSHFGKTSTPYFEPRLRLWYKLSDALIFQLNAGRYHQFLSQLTEFAGDNSSIDTPVWTFAGIRSVPILSSNQYLLGMVYQHNTWLVDVQFYQKKTMGLSTVAFAFSEEYSNRYHIGDSHARGIDLLIKKRWGQLRSWISYSHAKVDYHFPTFFDQDFPSPIDQRHVLRIANTWKFGAFDFSLGWEINSGKPYALKKNFDVVVQETNFGSLEILRPNTNTFNSGRLPNEHHLDAGIAYHISPKKLKSWEATIGFSIYNLYNQRNIYNRSFFIDKRPDTDHELKYFDRVDMGRMVNLVVRIEW